MHRGEWKNRYSSLCKLAVTLLLTRNQLERIKQRELLAALLFDDSEQTEIQNVGSFYMGAMHHLF